MRILILNYFYAPITNAHVYRWKQVAEFLSEQGHEVSVITSRVVGCPEAERINGVNVFRTGFKLEKNYDSKQHISYSKGIKSDLVDKIRVIYRKLYWPDAYWHWLFPLLVMLWKKRNSGYDFIISYYPCFSAHIAGGVFVRFLCQGNSIWIADYGDPFSTSDTMTPNNYKIYKKINFFIENSLSICAKYLTFTNYQTAGDYQKKIYRADKVRVIPHLVNIEKFYSGWYHARRVADQDNNKKINIVYVGSFHRGIREPYGLFKLIGNMNRILNGRICLHIYGQTNGCDMINSDEVIYHGTVPRELAVETMRNADVLVNVDNYNCTMIPSKIVECIATGRPVINIKSNSSEHPLIIQYASLGYGLSVNINDNHSIIEAAEFVKKNYKRIAEYDEVFNLLKEYDLKSVAKEYIGLCTD